MQIKGVLLVPISNLMMQSFIHVIPASPEIVGRVCKPHSLKLIFSISIDRPSWPKIRPLPRFGSNSRSKLELSRGV